MVPFAKMRQSGHSASSSRTHEEEAPAPYVVEREEDCVVRVYVQPRAKRSEIVGPHGDRLKLRVTAPPEDGRANTECQQLLAAVLGVPARRVTLARGAASRSKDFAVRGLAAAAASALLLGRASAG